MEHGICVLFPHSLDIIWTYFTLLHCLIESHLFYTGWQLTHPVFLKPLKLQGKCVSQHDNHLVPSGQSPNGDNSFAGQTNMLQSIFIDFLSGLDVQYIGNHTKLKLGNSFYLNCLEKLLFFLLSLYQRHRFKAQFSLSSVLVISPMLPGNPGSWKPHILYMSRLRNTELDKL